MFEIAINRPRWTEHRAVRWALRLTGIDRLWVARGQSFEALDRDVRRLAGRHGLTATKTPSGWTFSGPPGQPFEVTCK